MTEFKPIYYFYGTDDYLIEEACGKIRLEALQGGFESMNYNAYSGKNLNAADVVAAAATFPAFSPRRVILIKEAESIKAAEEKALLEYIKDPAPHTCLLFAAATGKIDRSAPFFKTLSEGGYLVACNKLGDRELSAWVRKEVKRQGKDISDITVQKLLSITGNRLRDVKGELDKIIIFAGDKVQILDSDVEEAGLDCREETIFGLSDAIGAKDLKKALKILEKISDEPPLKVLGAISRQIRMLLKLKALQRKKVVQGIPGILGVPPMFLDGYLRSVKRFTEKELRRAMERLCAADMDFKTGRIPEGVVLPKLIIDLCS